MDKKKTFEEFALSLHPELKEQYEMYTTPIEDLLGKEVVATTSGFSCGNSGGTRMIVGKVEGNKVNLLPVEGTREYEQSPLGWLCYVEAIPFSFKLVKSES